MTPGEQREYREAIRDRCEQLGVEAAKEWLAEGRFGERKVPIVRQWIAEQEGPALAEEEALQREIDRDIARKANRIALGALLISGLSTVIALLALGIACYVALIEHPLKLGRSASMAAKAK